MKRNGCELLLVLLVTRDMNDNFTPRVFLFFVTVSQTNPSCLRSLHVRRHGGVDLLPVLWLELGDRLEVEVDAVLPGLADEILAIGACNLVATLP